MIRKGNDMDTIDKFFDLFSTALTFIIVYNIIILILIIVGVVLIIYFGIKHYKKYIEKNNTN